MRLGESNRQIHATGLMGRRTLGSLRKQAEERGWLDANHPLPPDAELAEVLQSAKPAPWLHRQLLFGAPLRANAAGHVAAA
jgi:hypothetical protein